MIVGRAQKLDVCFSLMSGAFFGKCRSRGSFFKTSDHPFGIILPLLDERQRGTIPYPHR